jgi:hypothetical protein
MVTKISALKNDFINTNFLFYGYHKAYISLKIGIRKQDMDM